MDSVRRASACLALGMGLVGCPGGIDDVSPFLAARGQDAGVTGADVGVGPQCPDVVTEILSNPLVCAAVGCHATAANQANLDLEAPGVAERLWAAPAGPTCSGLFVIDPAAPESSLLYSKLLVPAPCGSTMPLGSPLPDEDVECVRRWILSEMEGRADAGVARDAGPLDTGPADTGVAGPDAGAPVTMQFEAENATVVEAPLVRRPGPEASGGEYVVVPLGPNRNDEPTATGEGRLELTFDVTEAATFYVWLRARAPSIESNSVWIRMDQGGWVRWNDINLNSEGVWRWDVVRNSDDVEMVVDYPLGAGRHVLEVNRREAGTQIDAVLITKDDTLDPNDG